MEFRLVETEDVALAAYVELFKRCFPNATHYSAGYLSWLYRENPAGLVVGFDAFEEGKLAAHYVCIPAPTIIEGQEQKSILSLNTATHPDYQGKGLFTRLASLTYERAANEGYNNAFGVANANSTPGFVRRLGFQNVGSLVAAIGVGTLYQKSARPEDLATFRRAWSKSLIDWRLANPVNPVAACPTRSGRWGFAAKTNIPATVVWSERNLSATELPRSGQGSRYKARLFIGNLPKRIAHSGLYFPIPSRFRPSPLNLIYRSLTNTESTIDAESVFFDFLDFDAF